MTTIAIPEGLFYFDHGILWEQFFKDLGCSIVVSNSTNKQLLDLGTRHCSNETCLPIKVFHGHVLSLIDKADYVFIPRYSSLHKNEFTCPKFCGLPDMDTLNLRRQLKVLEIKINMNDNHFQTFESLKKTSVLLGIKESDVFAAFENAWKVYGKNKFPIEKTKAKSRDGSKTSISILGHPYMIYDDYLSMKLIDKLIKKNIDVSTPRDIPFEVKRKNAYPFQGKAFWEVGFEILGSAFTFAKDPNIKGMIYLTPFACGLDAFILEFIERRLKSQDCYLPLLKLTIDEHTGEAGFDTRLEAFLDMVG